MTHTKQFSVDEFVSVVVSGLEVFRAVEDRYIRGFILETLAGLSPHGMVEGIYTMMGIHPSTGRRLRAHYRESSDRRVDALIEVLYNDCDISTLEDTYFALRGLAG